jgi:hypothetical protein
MDSLFPNALDDPETREDLALLLLCLFLICIDANKEELAHIADPQPYHTSALTGAAWVNELVNGHPDRIYHELGMRSEVFLEFVSKLRSVGLGNGRWVMLEEKAGIFLYMSVTGLRIRHVGERFQRSVETVSRAFREVLFAVSSDPFYSQYVHLPTSQDPISPHIRDNPKRYPLFKDCLGALDGTHIDACPAKEDRDTARNRKGRITQNVLAAVSFDMKFQYIVAGHDGSTADSTMLERARMADFRIPAGKYYLGDAGFTGSDSCVVPFRGVRYHLQEWGRANTRPQTKEELFNLRHSSLRNVVERIFGVLKKRWGLLMRPSQFNSHIQARIPCGLGAIHNFIMDNDPDYLDNSPFDDTDETDADRRLLHENDDDAGELADGLVSRAEKQRADAFRDTIARNMYNDYLRVLSEQYDDNEEIYGFRLELLEPCYFHAIECASASVSARRLDL